MLGAPLEILADHIAVKSNVPFGRKWEKTPITKTLLHICKLGKYIFRGLMSGGDCELWQKYTLQNGELYYRDTDGELKLCLAQSEVPAVLTEFHESSFGGHWGKDVTIANLRQRFYWPTMRKDVTAHLKKCEA